MSENSPALNKMLARELLQLFPPSVRGNVAGTASFHENYGPQYEVSISFNGSGLSFRRSELHPALRSLYAEPTTGIAVKTEDGRDAVLTAEGPELELFVTIGESRSQIASMWMFSGDMEFRQSAFEREIATLNFEPATLEAWRSKIDAGPLSDDEFDLLHRDLRLRPQQVAETIRAEMFKSEGSVTVLVPGDREYYARLVGGRNEASNLEEYAERCAANHIRRLLDWDFLPGLEQCLSICASSQLARLIDLSGRPAADVEHFFKWLSEEGDRWSQIAGIEVGIRSVPNFPNLEPLVANLIEAIRDEDVSQLDARLRLTASLFIFTDGELSRTHTLDGEPPFWRRLCATAQAAMIEKELIRVDGATDPKFWEALRAESFYLQTMVDLRIEPRWLPDLMTADVLRYDFLMRARIAAEDVGDKLPEGRLRELLLGKGSSSLSNHTLMPLSYLPSPVESASSASLPFPEEMLTELRAPKDEKPLDAKIFANIVNLALVFRFHPEIPSLIAGILRQIKYRLSLNPDSSVTFSLLVGLAILAGVTRSAELADELRVLARVLRRRGDLKVEPDNEMRVALYACSSRAELEEWCKALGHWVLELANEKMDRLGAQQLHSCLVHLCKIESRLWPYLAKAEAALSSLN